MFYKPYPLPGLTLFQVAETGQLVHGSGPIWEVVCKVLIKLCYQQTLKFATNIESILYTAHMLHVIT